MKGEADAELSELELCQSGSVLSSEYFEGRCVDLAKSLIGNYLFHKSPEGLVGGRIVETEAYLGANDPACHLSYGRTERTKPFFSGKGTIYIFKIFRYHNLNIISQFNQHPECILIRALEPTHGIELMRERRETDELAELMSGPGKLTEALGVKKDELNNTPLDGNPLKLIAPSNLDCEINSSPRIGISQAEDWPFRFTMKDSEYTSHRIKAQLNGEFDIEAYYNNLEPIENLSLTEAINSD